MPIHGDLALNVPEVEVIDLVKVYRNGTVAIDGVSFNAHRGVTALMGPNGSGKSTTLSIIAGALSPTSGEVLVCGYDVWGKDWLKARQVMGFAPQNMPFQEKLTLLENLTWYGLIRGMSLRESKRRGKELLELMGLDEHRNKKISQISGGMRKKLSIAAALIGDPEVLILDEPTSGLDPSARMELWNLIKEFAKEKTIIVSTHVAEDAERNSEKVIIFHRGKVVASGTPKELIERHAPEAVIVISGEFKEKVEVNEVKLLHFTDRAVSYATRDPEVVLPKIVETLISKGSTINKIEIKKPGLAEVYLALTGTHLEGAM